MRQLLLDSGWRLRQREPARVLHETFADDNGWIAATVPGNVHLDLLAAGMLPDPFEGLNEHAAQWVGEVDWLYRCDFALPEGFADDSAVALCCDGLDTVATVWLNGVELFRSDTMFVPQRALVTSLLRPGANQLQILFESALLHGRAREAEHGALACWNGETSRLYMRKAQYHYGWDWGPTLLTAGPWLPVRLEAYRARVAEVHAPPRVADDLASATLPVTVTLDVADQGEPAATAHLHAELTVRLELRDPEGALVAGATLPATGGAVHAELALAAPALWWPRGYGAQPLYTLRVSVERAGVELDRHEQRIGLRRLRLVQEPLAEEPGTTFYFEVNNTPIFCGGANWIPADSFTPRITAERYRALIEQAAGMHMVMLRVWGGGIYEPDVFYDLCDELGLLVWQDFMFACGIYPAQPWFQQRVRAEAEVQVKRLRHHACLVLWCGNNEDYQIAESRSVYVPATPPDASSNFPARVIYEQLLPEVCVRLDPTRSYWPGSPYAGTTTSDGTVGDRHVWNIWHGELAPYQDYPRFAGRFVSEFGMQAAPDLATIAAFAPPAERYPQSRTLDHHNKAAGGPMRLALYITENLPFPTDLERYVYSTQLLQSEALATAYCGWRRRWGGAGRYAVAGALVWQLNDCWPATSWALVDYYGRPKAACAAIRRCLAPLALGLARDEEGADVWAINGMLQPLEAQLELRTWTLAGEIVAVERATVSLPPNQATELGGFGFDPGGALVLDARLRVDGEVVARDALWPEPFKYYRLPDPLIVADLAGPETIRLRCVRPAKGVLLAAGDGVTWSDNMLDLMPDDERVIVARGLADRPVQLHWLGMDQ
jgi:beta-mannosidase